MDEARTVMRRLERIEALQSEQAPAAALLTEVRQLLREGEAWLAAEREGTGGRASCGDPALRGGGVADAAAALAGCRQRLGDRREVTAQTVESASL